MKKERISIHRLSIRFMYIWLTGKEIPSGLDISDAMSEIKSHFNSDENNEIEGHEKVDDFKALVSKANDLRFDAFVASMAMSHDEDLKNLIAKYSTNKAAN